MFEFFLLHCALFFYGKIILIIYSTIIFNILPGEKFHLKYMHCWEATSVILIPINLQLKVQGK